MRQKELWCTDATSYRLASSAPEEPSEEPTARGLFRVTLTPVDARNPLHHLVHMLPAARPVLFPAHPARHLSAHLVLLRLARLVPNSRQTIPLGVLSQA